MLRECTGGLCSHGVAKQMLTRDPKRRLTVASPLGVGSPARHGRASSYPSSECVHRAAVPAVRVLYWIHPSSATGLGCFEFLGTGISRIAVLPPLLQKGPALGWRCSSGMAGEML